MRTPSHIVLTTLLACVAGCAGETDETVSTRIHTSTVQQRIMGGDLDNDAAALAGVVALRVGAGGTFELCSGAVLAPNLVLTARHCVTKNITTSVSCDENGRSANGEHVSGDQEPQNIGVYVGATPAFASKPTAIGKAIVAPQGPYLCDSDIALVVLDRPLANVTPLPVRLDTPARAGERIRSVGYGQNDLETPIGTRFRKEGVEVLAQGSTISKSRTPLGRHEFEVGRSICQGDSGGPAIAEGSGAVIGVVSRGGKCEQDYGHIYTTTAGFEELFAEAARLAKASLDIETDAPEVVARAGQAPAGPAAEEPTAAEAGACAMAPAGTSRIPLTPAVGMLVAGALALGARRRRA